MKNHIMIFLLIMLPLSIIDANVDAKKQTNSSQPQEKIMAKKILFILMPERYQDEEFLTPYDMLKNANHYVDVAGLKAGEAAGTMGHTFTPNLLLENLGVQEFATYDALVIPGGPASTKYLWDNKRIQNVIQYFYKNKKVVATICYACIAPAQAGILKGKVATVFPTDEAKQHFTRHNVTFSKDGCVTLKEDKIITAQGPSFAKSFGKAILDLLASE